VVVKHSERSKQDHSPECREKCVQKEFDRADIVRDVRFPDLPGAGKAQL